jgi:tetratricopeptide (TPR) repeat protein
MGDSDDLAREAIRILEYADPEADRLEFGRALGRLRQAIAATEAVNPNRRSFLFHMGIAVRRKAYATEDLADVEEALLYLREADAAGHADGGVCRFELGRTVMERFFLTDAASDLEEAIRLFRLAVNADAACARFHSSLGDALERRAERDESLDHIDQAIEAYRRALDAAADDDGDRFDYLTDLASGLTWRFQRNGAERDVGEGVTLLRQALALPGVDPSDRARGCSDLAEMLTLRFAVSGDASDLDDAIVHGRKAIELDPDRRTSRWILERALRRRFRHGSDIADLDELIELLSRNLAARPDDHPIKVAETLDLAFHLRVQFSYVRDLACLDRAVALAQQAVAAAPLGHPHRADALGELAASLVMRMPFADLDADLDLLITACEQRRPLIPPEHPHHLALVRDLGGAYLTRFRKTGRIADLDAAAELYRSAAVHLDAGVRAEFQAALATVLETRGRHTDQPKDLEAAVDWARRALDIAPPDDPERPQRLSAFMSMLGSRAEMTGDPVHLDLAIDAAREVSACRTDPAERAEGLSALSMLLRRRFELTGAAADITAAVALAGEAVEAAPPDHPYRPVMLTAYSAALKADPKRSRAPEAFDRVIELCRQAVAATPPDHPFLPTIMNDLANALHARALRSQKAADLDDLVGVRERATAAAEHGSPQWRMLASNLASDLTARFNASRRIQDLDTSIALAAEVLDSRGTSDSARASTLSVLASALQIRYEHSGRIEDARRAIGASRECARLDSARPWFRITEAQRWGTVAASIQDWTEALEGYASALASLPSVAGRNVRRADGERSLSNWGWLAGDAAACAVMTGDLDRAVALLEHGRGVMWAGLLEGRSDLDAVRKVAPELADELDHVRCALDALDSSDEAALGAASSREGDPRGLEADRRSDRRHELARQWDELVAAVRSLPGLASFLRPLTADRLRDAASDGPVVLVNISRWRCDALVVTRSGIRLIELPNLTRDEVIERALEYAALWKFDLPRGGDQTRAAAEQTITATLNWLWEHLAEPVLASLGHVGRPAETERWPRVWWCPTGVLAELPLHAAGRPAEDTGAEPDASVLDRVVSSYTPTLRALMEARSTRPVEAPAGCDDETVEGKVLFVSASPTDSDSSALRHVSREKEQLRHLLGPGQMVEVPWRDATIANVRDALGSHRWAQLSGHGWQDEYNPSLGGLKLVDGTWSVSDVVAHVGGFDGELIVLSACETAVGGVRLVDEVISLAAALHYSGWRNVVGSLSPVWDGAAADITVDFYRHCVRDRRIASQDAALSLHHAVRSARERYRSNPSAWVPFIHIGT